jgi:hypothetical protein
MGFKEGCPSTDPKIKDRARLEKSSITLHYFPYRDLIVLEGYYNKGYLTE